MQVVITGHEGMLGTYVKKVLKDYDLILPKKGYDDFKNKIVVNCAGIIRGRNGNMNASNFILPMEIFKQTSKLIHISTDCVFSGKRGFYRIEDKPDPLDEYGRTKLMGEYGVVIRTSILGESNKGRGLLEWARKQTEIDGYYTHLWNGVTCLSLAYFIRSLIDVANFTPGIIHLCSDKIYSKYEICRMIKDIYDLNITINKTWKLPKNMTLSGVEISDDLYSMLKIQKNFDIY